MVNDLFLIARAEAGGLPLQREAIALGDLAGRVVSDFETLVEQRAGTIRIAHAAPVVALVDCSRLRRALAALIENALQHCERGVNIEVEIAAEDGFAVISVSDDGPGLDFAKADQLFQRFRRGRTRAEGSGLGLSLVRALVAAHGGTTLLAPRQGGGTCVAMRLPMAASHEAAA
jgi:two-component system sensor histidine kinase TctE